MPRLPVWVGCATIACGGYYGFYHRLYLPYHTTRREFEVAAEAEKLELQSLLRRYAALRHSVRTLPHGTCATNRERLSLYCELQCLREGFYNLPLAAQSAADKRAVLRDLDEMQSVHCTALNFRDEALGLWQVLKCQFCFGLYVVCFCLFDALLQRAQCVVAVEQLRRQWLHVAAKWILRCLSIPVSMTLEEPPAPLSDAADGDKKGGDGDVYYMVFLPQHWIEVVGFWASPTNPMLHSTRVRLLSSTFFAPAMPFEVHWREQGLHKGLCGDRGASGATHSDATTSTSTYGANLGEEGSFVESSFGYPLASSVACRRGGGGGVVVAEGADALHVLPVVSSGLPRLLFVSDAVARPDVRLKKTLKEVYTEVQQRQFPVHQPGSGHAASEQRLGEGALSREDIVWERRLRAWQRRGGVPLWHRATWGSVYGGVGCEGSRDRRELSFRVGPLCRVGNLISKQMELQRRHLMAEKPEVERRVSSLAAILTPFRCRGAKPDDGSEDNTRHGVHPAAPVAVSAEATASGELLMRHARVTPPEASMYPRVRVALHEHNKEEQQQQQQVEAEAENGRGHEIPSANESEAAAAIDLLCGPRDDRNEVRSFLDERERELEQAQLQRNAAIPYPTHPDDMIPEFRRVKRHQAMVVIATDPEYPVYPRRDQFVQLPPPAMHPWVKNTPVGPFILHGDGQLGVAGSGEVGFDDAHVTETLPRAFRGLQHHSVLQRQLPQKNGKVLQDAVVKNSFTLTGRGVFATRNVAAGETIMIVRSTARNLGVKGELERLVEMCGDVLLAVYESRNAEELDFLHNWVLTGQPSSLLEHWPASATQQVLERIGGVGVLHALELHEIHIARLAAVIEMNSLLVESSYGVRKGMAYFPEAGFLNHSCAPNATYDVIPEHTFRHTDYYVDEVEENAAAAARGGNDEDEGSTAAMAASVSPPSSSSRVLSVDCDVCQVEANGTSSSGDGDSDSRTAACHSLTTEGPVTYLFCCRATTDIAAGTEILISYVPPSWSFDNRQYVLHDRYRFWCKCPKCAPTLDATYARVPRMIVGLLLFSVALQLLVVHQRNTEQMALREHQTEEEIATASSSHGGYSHRGDAAVPRRSKGLFEMIEDDRLQEVFSPDRVPLPAVLANDPWAKPPR